MGRTKLHRQCCSYTLMKPQFKNTHSCAVEKKKKNIVPKTCAEKTLREKAGHSFIK